MKYLPYLAIIVVAAFLRMYAMWEVPPAPSLDEVSIGYNAYSILMTGKDEYGSSYPLLLRAYDDWRPALYVYLTVPFVWLMGLTVTAVRMPSVLLSLITVSCVFELGRMIGKKYLRFELLGVVSSLILAISPWHIYLSRLGHEVNAGLALVVLGVLSFLKAVLEDKRAYVLLSAGFFGLSLHGYQSEKLVSPAIVFVLGLLFWKKLRSMRGYVVIAVLIGSIIAFPATWATVSPEGMVRFRGTTAFSDADPTVARHRDLYVSALKEGDVLGRIFHSTYVSYLVVFMRNYVLHFAPAWLYAGGEREAHKAPGTGLMYLWELPVFLAGLWALRRSTSLRAIGAVLAAGILTAPLPAAITTGAPHAMRAVTAAPFLALVEAIGIWYLIKELSFRARRIAAGAFTVLILGSLVMFWNGYFIRFPREQSDSFQYALKDAVDFAVKENARYVSIDFANHDALYQSYMFFLYYSGFDPATYQRLGGTKSGGYNEAHYIGKFAFGVLPKQVSDAKKGTLYFYNAGDVPEGMRTVRTFMLADGTPAIVAAIKEAP